MAAMRPAQAGAVMQEPSIIDKRLTAKATPAVKMGFTMGGMVGLTIGFIFGSATILKNGAGPKGFFGSVSQYMVTSGATFAFFMSIGSVIRTEDRDSFQASLAARQPASQGAATPAWLVARFRSLQQHQQ